MSGSHWSFGPFRLDPPDACLWHGAEAISVKPKTFAVLQYLVAHAGQLVTKEAIMEAVWPEVAVGDGVLKVCINEIRKALGDTARTPQFVATVHRRGYRFIAPVTAIDPSATDQTPPTSPDVSSVSPWFFSHGAAPLVEREAILSRLHTTLAQARRGTRQVVFVTGEPGIGKTAVVETFVAQAVAQGTWWFARGQCVEHYGTGEAYLPVLEALGQLCRVPEGERLLALLRQQAPTWMVQMPWLLTATDRELLQQELQGVTRERMLREFAELLDTLTAETPLVLVLEDLHWSDYATLDLLALLARRRQAAQLLILGTYRPVEVIVQGHPLRTVTRELRRHGHCTDLPLTLLSAAAVAAYLTRRFPGQQFPDTFVWWLHQHTDGHPLFLVTMVQTLVERGVLSMADGRLALCGDLGAVAVGVSEGVRPLLEQQLTRLAPAVQRVLEVASVVGVEFAAAAVAAGLETDVDETEEHCEELVQQQMLRAVDMTTWPDGTMAMRYAFTHGLYQQMAYQRLGEGQRLRLHQRIGVRLEAAYGARAGEMAAELAEHFVRGQDTPRALRYLRQAAENAAQRYAPYEVIGPLKRALELLATLPETPARAQQELEVQIVLGSALVATRGYAAAEVEQTYARARALCMQVGDTPQLFPVLRGLCAFYLTRGTLPTARELGEQLHRQAQHTAMPTPRLEAHDTLGGILFYLGDYTAARIHLEQGIGLTDPVAQRALALRHGEAPGVRCLALAALTLWCLGYPAQAMRRGQEALALARDLAHPQSLVMAQFFAAYLHHRRREAPAVQAQAEALLTLATAQGFPPWAGFGTCWQGWALAMQGQGETGLAQLHQGMAAVLATGQSLSRPFCLVLLAEAARHADQVKEGLRWLAEALAALGASGRGDLLAEAYRLQGELLLRQAVEAGFESAPMVVAQAAACFQQALALARHQQAKSWELRAALSLSRLWQRQGKRAEARQVLVTVYSWFTEGFDTADLQEAQALLAALG